MNIKSIAVIAALTVQTLLQGQASAGEGVRPAGPIGGTDIRQAMLPPPGFYVVGAGIVGNFDDFFLSNGDKLDSTGPFKVGGVGFLAAYKTEVFGGRLASSVFISGGDTCFRIKNTPNSCSTGMGDTYADVLMWTRHFPSKAAPSANPMVQYGLDTLLSFGVSFPTGAYDKKSAVNNGSNVYDFAPNVGLTYTMPSVFGPAFGDATEISGRFFYNTYTHNDATDYQSGDVISADFAISQRKGPFQFGLTGTGYVQTQDDKIGGVTVPGGNRAKMLQLGPVFSYDMMANGRPWNVTVKGLFSVKGENVPGPDLIVVRLGTKLF